MAGITSEVRIANKDQTGEQSEAKNQRGKGIKARTRQAKRSRRQLERRTKWGDNQSSKERGERAVIVSWQEPDRKRDQGKNQRGKEFKATTRAPKKVRWQPEQQRERWERQKDNGGKCEQWSWAQSSETGQLRGWSEWAQTTGLE